jgi:hypothetical protein
MGEGQIGTGTMFRSIAKSYPSTRLLDRITMLTNHCLPVRQDLKETKGVKLESPVHDIFCVKGKVQHPAKPKKHGWRSELAQHIASDKT